MTSESLKSLNLSIWVPTEQVGVVIGKQGATISRIQSETSTRVITDKGEKGAESCWAPIAIKGPPNGVFSACRMVSDIVDELDDGVAEFQIPRQRHARIIGPRGETIRSISAQSAVRIMVPDNKGKDDRIQLEGEVNRIARAFEMVVDAAFGKPQDGAAKGKENKEGQDSTQDTTETLAARGPVIERTLEVAAKAVALLVAGGRRSLAPYRQLARLSGTTITRDKARAATSSDPGAPAGENGPTVGDKATGPDEANPQDSEMDTASHLGGTPPFAGDAETALMADEGASVADDEDDRGGDENGSVDDDDGGEEDGEDEDEDGVEVDEEDDDVELDDDDDDDGEDDDDEEDDGGDDVDDDVDEDEDEDVGDAPDDADENDCHADESEECSVDGGVDADDGTEHSEIPAAHEDSDVPACDDGAATREPLDTSADLDCDEPLADAPSAADDASKLSEASETAASFTVRGREAQVQVACDALARLVNGESIKDVTAWLRTKQQSRSRGQARANGGGRSRGGAGRTSNGGDEGGGDRAGSAKGARPEAGDAKAGEGKQSSRGGGRRSQARGRRGGGGGGGGAPAK